MVTIRVTTNEGPKVIEAAGISERRDFNGFYLWELDKPVRIDGVEMPDEAYIDFGQNAVIAIGNNSSSNGQVYLNMQNQYGELRCYTPHINMLLLRPVPDSLGDPIELNNISGDIGPFVYNLNIHLDTDDYTKSYFSITLSAMDINLCNAYLDINNPRITFGASMCGVGVKGTLGIDFDEGRIYLEAEIEYFVGTKKYSYDLYNWKNYNVQFVPSSENKEVLCVASSSADALGGRISIENRGAYVAKFTVSYDLNGKRITNETDNYTSGVTKSVEVPADAVNIQLCAMDAWFFGQWNDIFSKTFEKPVNKKYRISGTTLNTSFEEIKV